MDRIIPLLRSAVWVAFIIAFNSPLSAQSSRSADRSPADPADVESVDAIIAAVYDVISGPAGQERDWDRMRSLFIPGARLIPTFPRLDRRLAAPFARGINSFQLLYDGSRWWVVTIFWQGESPDHPIPAEYLPTR